MVPNSKLILLSMVVMLALAVPRTVFGLRCDHRVISVGDSAERVLKYCGPPDYQERRRVGTRVGFYRNPHAGGDTQRSPGASRESAGMERWTYDFGANRLVHRLDFMNGRLTDIRTGYQGG